LERKLAQAQSTADIALTTAVSAEIATMETTEPEAPLVTEEVIPESSDDGPPAKEEEKPAAKKPAWHHWI
jgi:myosin-crossreactive antigen